MRNFDFDFCEFIESNLSFITFNDFCQNRHAIKKQFDTFKRSQKRFYMWYIYANIHINEKFKNYIWDYLNGYMSEEDLLYRKRFYKAN